ncbi:MAG: hypothetical protein ACRDHX_14870 [Chloroflexota bacterium]
MNAVIGGVETPYQVVAITRQLLDRRVLPKAISYVSRYTEELGTLIATSIEVAAPGAARNVIDNWIIPQPEAARITRRSFVEAGLADLNGPEVEGYGKLLGHGWLLADVAAAVQHAGPLSDWMAACKAILDTGIILVACRLDAFTAGLVTPIFQECSARHIATFDVQPVPA